MKPVKFKHQTTVFAKDQSQYQPLPALVIDSPSGEVISCWKLSLKERFKVFVFGRVWMSLMSFNNKRLKYASGKKVYSAFLSPH
jgi:hypothetical protein